MSFDGLLISLNKGDFDLVMAALTPSEERKQIVDFTDIIFSNDQIVVIRKEDADKYTDIASLNGVKGGFQKGTVQEEIANGVVGEANTVGLTKFYDLITELKTGKLDCVFTNVLVGRLCIAMKTSSSRCRHRYDVTICEQYKKYRSCSMSISALSKCKTKDSSINTSKKQ